jgi:hypothetical protein
MSGMPLQVGDLPPGVVVVRVIRQDFGTNVVGQPVTLREPFSTRAQRVVTDAEGRAEFDAFEVGTTVQAQATLDDEILSSQMFTLPAKGGVRLVLVAGVGAGVPGVNPAVLMRTASPGSAATGSPSSWAALFALVFGAAVVTLAGVWILKPRLGPGTRRHVRAPAVTPDPGVRRAEAFEELVRLEKGHRSPHVSDAAYRARRAELLEEIVALDASRTGVAPQSSTGVE